MTPDPIPVPASGAERLFRILLGAFAVSFLAELAGMLGWVASSWADFIFWLLAALLTGMVWRDRVGARRAAVCAAWVIAIAAAVLAWTAARVWLLGPFVFAGAEQPQWGGVPLAVPLAWWVVVGGTHLVVEGLWGEWRAGVSALTALVAVEVALLMEPVQVLVRRDRVWLAPGAYFGVPWEYFAGWFALALGLTLGLVFLGNNISSAASRARRQAWLPALTLLAVVLVFGAAALAHRLWLPAAFGGLNALLFGSVLVRRELTRLGRPAG